MVYYFNSEHLRNTLYRNAKVLKSRKIVLLSLLTLPYSITWQRQPFVMSLFLGTLGTVLMWNAQFDVVKFVNKKGANKEFTTLLNRKLLCILIWRTLYIWIQTPCPDWRTIKCYVYVDYLVLVLLWNDGILALILGCVICKIMYRYYRLWCDHLVDYIGWFLLTVL